MFLRYQLIAVFVCLGMPAAAGALESTATCDVRTVGSKEKMQSGDMLAVIEARKQWLQRDPDSPENGRIARKLQELEQRVNELRAKERAAGIFYCRRNDINAQDFIAEIAAKIEHCSFANFPKKDGRGIYGSGEVQFTIDGWGRLVEAAIDKSSGDALIDEHMMKIIGASAPFGDVPNYLLIGGYKRIRFTLAFSFEDDKKAKPAKVPREKCVLH